MITEAFATVDMPVVSKKRASFQCKVDTGAGGNGMPLRAFTKLFPNRFTKTEFFLHLQNQWCCIYVTIVEGSICLSVCQVVFRVSSKALRSRGMGAALKVLKMVFPIILYVARGKTFC